MNPAWRGVFLWPFGWFIERVTARKYRQRENLTDHPKPRRDRRLLRLYSPLVAVEKSGATPEGLTLQLQLQLPVNLFKLRLIVLRHHPDKPFATVDQAPELRSLRITERSAGAEPEASRHNILSAHRNETLRGRT